MKFVQGIISTVKNVFQAETWQTKVVVLEAEILRFFFFFLGKVKKKKKDCPLLRYRIGRLWNFSMLFSVLL